MSESSKQGYRGYRGLSDPGKSVNFMTGLLENESTGLNMVHKDNISNLNTRKETADSIKRRGIGGYRGAI